MCLCGDAHNHSANLNELLVSLDANDYSTIELTLRQIAEELAQFRILAPQFIDDGLDRYGAR